MKKTLLLLIAAVTLVNSKPIASSDEDSSAKAREVFCQDHVEVYFIGADKSVTSPPEDRRLRVFRMQDGKLLLHIEHRLIYPMVPSITPIVQSENGAIILPDLQTKGAAVALSMPTGVDKILIGILQDPNRSSSDSKILSHVEAFAEVLERKAESLKKYIEQRAAKLQTGAPAEAGPYTGLRNSARHAKAVTGVVVNATDWAVNWVEKTTVHLASRVQGGTVKLLNLFGKQHNAEKNERDDMTVAVEKITNVLQKSAFMLTKTLEQNAAQVFQHKFGGDMGETVTDAIHSAKNAVKAAIDVHNLTPDNILKRQFGHIGDAIIAPYSEVVKTATQYGCTED